MKKRSVLLIGLDEKGGVLLHHKTPDAPNNANLWVLLGGSIEEGEHPDEAMRREIKEELDLDIHPIFFKTYTQNDVWGETERHIFYTHIIEPIEKLRLAQTEGDGMDFFSKEKIKDLPMNDNHKNIVQEFLASAHE
jgi:8-oxo-dGTP diphosphatase